MLLRYLFGRQLLCRQCLSLIKRPTHQQRFQFLPPKKQFSIALPRLSFPQGNNDPPQGSQELRDHWQTPKLPGNEENQAAATTTTGSTSPDAALGDASEPLPDLPHIPKKAKLRNEDIIPLNGEIHYVDANKAHHGIVKFADVINSFDRDEYALVCMNPTVVFQNEPPTCRLMPIADLLAKERREAEAAAEALLKRQQKPAIPTKVLEFTWAISANDLAHKMKKMTEFMRKGNRVEVVIGTRKGMAKVMAGQAREVLAKIRETGMEFGREWRKADGALGKQLTLFFEGRAPVKPEGKEGGEVEKKQKRKRKRKFMTPEELEAEEAEAEAEREKKRREGSGVCGV